MPSSTRTARRLAESQRFPLQGGYITADLDLDHLRQERMRWTTFGDCVQAHKAQLEGYLRVEIELDVPADRVRLDRRIERFPYVPADPARRDERCAEVYDIQVEALRKRLAATGLKKVVIGISGGLDSTQTALVAVRAFDRLGLPRTNILGYTLPGFGTSRETFENAHALMRALGITAAEIDIRPSAELMLQHIGHPAARGEPVYDITYENVQAGERTSHLFRLANHHNALVLGTGDLSELALGFTTYGVGDHMSHYNVNASVPKTLIRHLIRWLVGARTFRRRDGRRAHAHRGDPDFAGAGARRGRQARAIVRGRRRPVRAAGLPSLLHQPLRLSPEQGRLSRALRMERRHDRSMARDRAACGPSLVRPADDHCVARSVPASLFPGQPVQALGDAEWSQGRLGWIVVAARRLARAQ